MSDEPTDPRPSHPMKSCKLIRITVNKTGEIWLHVKAPSGKAGGVNLSAAVSPKMKNLRAALLEVAH